jgi:hypothetical protein
MVVKALALELYKAQQKLHKLQDQYDGAELKDRERLRRELQQAEAERDQLRRLIDGRKEKPLFRTSFQDDR